MNLACDSPFKTYKVWPFTIYDELQSVDYEFKSAARRPARGATSGFTTWARQGFVKLSRRKRAHEDLFEAQCKWPDSNPS